MKNAGQFPILHANPRKNLCRTIVDNGKISQIPSHRRIFSPSTVILTLNINERRKSQRVEFPNTIKIQVLVICNASTHSALEIQISACHQLFSSLLQMKENDLRERELFAIEIVREEREKSIGSIEWRARIPINKDMDNQKRASLIIEVIDRRSWNTRMNKNGKSSSVAKFLRDENLLQGIVQFSKLNKFSQL